MDDGAFITGMEEGDMSVMTGTVTMECGIGLMERDIW